MTDVQTFSLFWSQAAPGSAAEGCKRFLLECTDFDAEEGSGNLQEWVPLVYPDANAAVPYVLVRLPIEPQRPPAPIKEWKAGDRCEVPAPCLVVCYWTMSCLEISVAVSYVGGLVTMCDASMLYLQLSAAVSCVLGGEILSPV